MAKLYEKSLQALSATDAGRTIYGERGLWGTVALNAKGGVSIAFSFRYRAGTRTRDFGCGSWPTASLAEVTAKRDKAHDRVRLGGDPIDERAAEKARKKAEQAKAKPLTVRALFDLWRASELKDRRDQGAEPLRALSKDIFPALGHQPAESVTKGKYLEQLDSIKNRAPALANNLLSYLSRMYAWGTNRELVPTNPLEDTTRKEVGGSGGERERVLSMAELTELHAALDTAALPPAVRHGLMVILGTAARSGELLKARKAEISLEDRIWRIPSENSKNGKAHLIILSPWAAWHMGKLFTLSGASPWLMPVDGDPLSHVHGRTLVNATADRQCGPYGRKTEGRSLNYADTLALGGEKWTPHDLRRTAATIMGDKGVPPDVIDKCLNHTEPNKVRRTYQRSVKAEEQQAAWLALGELLQGPMPIAELVLAPSA